MFACTEAHTQSTIFPSSPYVCLMWGILILCWGREVFVCLNWGIHEKFREMPEKLEHRFLRFSMAIHTDDNLLSSFLFLGETAAINQQWGGRALLPFEVRDWISKEDRFCDEADNICVPHYERKMYACSEANKSWKFNLFASIEAENASTKSMCACNEAYKRILPDDRVKKSCYELK